jgi:hypothetical protein
MTSLTRAGAVAGLLALLAGCGVFDKEPPKPCPVVLVLKDAAEVVRYRPGPGRDLLDVAYRAGFGENKLECRYKGNRLGVALDVEVVVERGPGAEAAEARIPYFVAVLNERQKVLAREVFEARVVFEEGRRRGIAKEELTQRFRLEDFQTGANFEIVIGFELDQSELDENRRRQRR